MRQGEAVTPRPARRPRCAASSLGAQPLERARSLMRGESCLLRQPYRPGADQESILVTPRFRAAHSSGTPGRTRTHNLLVRSQTLYPLSYEGARPPYPASPHGRNSVRRNRAFTVQTQAFRCPLYAESHGYRDCRSQPDHRLCVVRARARAGWWRSLARRLRGVPVAVRATTRSAWPDQTELAPIRGRPG